MDACCLRARGDVWAGYRCLTLGLEQALEVASHAPWGQELADAYLGALQYYAELPPAPQWNPGRASAASPGPSLRRPSPRRILSH